MTPDHRKCPMTRGDNGFTLVEMLVVLSILAITAVVAWPLAGGSRTGRALEAAAAGLASELKSARATAIRSNVEQTLTIDTSARLFTRNGWTVPRPLPEAIDIALETIRSEQSGSTSGRFRFYPDGSATGGRIVLGSGSRRAVVAVDWLTGGTRVSVDN